jgi:hypothetical protein
MLDWILANHRDLVRASRWIVTGCGLALMAIAQLPHDLFDRALAVVGMICVAIAFLIWFGVVIVTIVRPRTFEEIRRRRADRSR